MPRYLKSIIILSLVCLSAVNAQNQTLQVPFPKITADSLLTMELPKQMFPDHWPGDMTYSEFNMIRRKLTWKRIFLAAMVPGYIHFYIDRPKWGYSIAVVRGSGYLLIAYALADQARSMDGYTNSLFEIPQTPASLQKRSERNLLLFLSGIGLNMCGFATDLAHGDWTIEAEKTSVLFKYKIQLNREVSID